MEKILEKILSYNKAWFGLIFIGSVLNAIALKLSAFNNVPNISIWCFYLVFWLVLLLTLGVSGYGYS